MFLSKLMINVRSREFRRDYANVHDMHRTIMRAYPSVDADTQARLQHKVLWRLDTTGIGYTQYVQSYTEPSWGDLPAGLLLSPAQVQPLAPVLDAISPGRKFHFRLLANPTRSARVENGQDVRKRRAHTTPEAQIQWLISRGERDGFAIPTARSGEPDVAPSPVPTLVGQKKEQGKITVVPVRFDGHLIVTDAEAFTEALINGVGRAKAYGCGLISLAPPRVNR
ncbi:type I-E CRISPR-associated protein Cas6/Cse3/CasE [Lentzea sp. DG1S-22]|uniref:type I-E CRISPR-associated protein Cas6/Cse3/CasE n=1 Tax=Lentzea sp. DG1S-22 TaxID=3108822 RepID=UPI002E761655|nr:type I-E CRISPR-associated protein Cas6/Cse3/CasE [Lentzea sp. DG1S-22]WVH82759.1 type I-E CRISPR-associated protein Cas6/Cse3/CasE [Lentzea sp. DG1S-22]